MPYYALVIKYTFTMTNVIPINKCEIVRKCYISFKACGTHLSRSYFMAINGAFCHANNWSDTSIPHMPNKKIKKLLSYKQSEIDPGNK